MTLLPRAPRVILRFDAITVQRPSASVDGEGNPAGGRQTVFVGRGTISTAGTQEQLVAQSRGSKIDKILSLELGLDVQAGDFVSSGTSIYEVIDIEDRRLFQRAIMRRVV